MANTEFWLDDGVVTNAIIFLNGSRMLRKLGFQPFKNAFHSLSPSASCFSRKLDGICNRLPPFSKVYRRPQTVTPRSRLEPVDMLERRVKSVVHDDYAALSTQYAHIMPRPVTAFTVLGIRAHGRDYLATGTSLRPSQTS